MLKKAVQVPRRKHLLNQFCAPAAAWHVVSIRMCAEQLLEQDHHRNFVRQWLVHTKRSLTRTECLGAIKTVAPQTLRGSGSFNSSRRKAKTRSPQAATEHKNSRRQGNAAQTCAQVSRYRPIHFLNAICGITANLKIQAPLLW